MTKQAVIWVVGDAGERGRAEALLDALRGQGACFTLGQPGEVPPDLDLGPEPDLGLALESCPQGLRPAACAWLGAEAGRAQAGLDGLPCPVLGWGGPGPEGRLPDEPLSAARDLFKAAETGLELAWASRVQANMPLMMLFERYQPLVAANIFNLEVGLDFRTLDGLGPEELGRARALLAGRRVTVHLPFGDLAPGSPDPKVRGVAALRLGQAATWALELGAVQAVMHLGYDRRMHPDPAEYAERLARNLWPLAVRLNQGGCRLALENVFEPDPRVLLLARRALMDQGVSQVGFCLDVGHAQVFSQSSPQEFWEALSPYLFEMHLHDNDGQGDLHLPPGQGGLDWSWLGRQLAALAETPILTLEPHRESHLWASLRALERLWGRPAD